jgi:hypothetical protein
MRLHGLTDFRRRWRSCLATRSATIVRPQDLVRKNLSRTSIRSVLAHVQFSAYGSSLGGDSSAYSAQTRRFEK